MFCTWQPADLANLHPPHTQILDFSAALSAAVQTYTYIIMYGGE